MYFIESIMAENIMNWEISEKTIAIPVAIILSPGESIPPGGRMKQLFGAVV